MYVKVDTGIFAALHQNLKLGSNGDVKKELKHDQVLDPGFGVQSKGNDTHMWDPGLDPVDWVKECCYKETTDVK